MATQEYKFLNQNVTADPVTGKVVNTVPNSAIAVDQIQPTPSINLPVPNFSTTEADTAIAGVNATIPSMQSYIDSLNTAPTQAEQAQSSVLDSLAYLTGQNTGKEQYRIQQENNLGLPNFSTQLAQTQGDIIQKTAESATIDAKYQKELSNIELNSRTAFDYSNRVGSLNRQIQADKALKASELTMLYAKQTALQGNIANARGLADRAVELKYQPIEDEIKIKESQLKAIQPFLDKDQEKRALAQQLFLEDRRQKIADQKEKEKALQSISLEAAKFGADSEIISQMQGAKSIGEALSLASPYLSAEFKQKVEQQKFENNVQLQQLALSRASLGVTQARLAFDKAKEQFDQQIKLLDLAGKNGGQISVDSSGNIISQPSNSNIQRSSLAKANVDLVTSLISDKGLNSSVGPNYLSRFSAVNKLSGSKSNFIAGVEQVRSQLNLDTLVRAKASGATFGALSDNELQVLANAASKIGQWAIKKDGKVTGYDASEKDFRDELDKINNFAKLDYVLKGGKPEDVDVLIQDDGTYWTKNSNGTLTQIR